MHGYEDAIVWLPAGRFGRLQPLSPRKRKSHSKNRFHESEKIRGHMKRISGLPLKDILMGLEEGGIVGSRVGHRSTPRIFGFPKLTQSR